MTWYWLFSTVQKFYKAGTRSVTTLLMKITGCSQSQCWLLNKTTVGTVNFPMLNLHQFFNSFCLMFFQHIVEIWTLNDQHRIETSKYRCQINVES